jgi:6-phosphogluconolactonase (cycloisomerase 2 family)
MMNEKGNVAMKAGRGVTGWTTVLAAGAALAMTGCSDFFPPLSSGGNSGGGSTTNVAYVANSATNSLSGFAVGTAKLTTVPNMPYALGYTPQALVVSESNSYLYVAGLGAIYGYVIGTDGSLTVPSTGAALVNVNVAALDVSPDGQYLFGLDNTSTQLDVFAINQTTGGLTLASTAAYSVKTGTVVPKAIKSAPMATSGSFLVFAALGTGGDVVFTVNTTTGAAALSQTLGPVSTTTSDNGLAVDSTVSYLYIARSGTSGGLAVYTIGTGGVLNSISGSPFAAGAQPLAVQLDSTSKFAYVANGSDATVSGYSLVNGVATALSGSPYASGQSVRSLGLDRTGAYLTAVGFSGSPDLTMYSFDATVAGKLDSVATTATGTDPAGALAVAMTH